MAGSLQGRFFSLYRRGFFEREACTPVTDVLLLFDANLAGPLSCRAGCHTDSDHLCQHRFAERNITTTRLPVRSRNTPDFGVVKYFIMFIARALAEKTLFHTRWIIVTRDKGFLTTVRHSYKSRLRRYLYHPQLLFGGECIWTIIAHRIICIEVLVIGSKEYGQGTAADLHRIMDRLNDVLSSPRPW